jgi:hypothetical protein
LEFKPNLNFFGNCKGFKINPLANGIESTPQMSPRGLASTTLNWPGLNSAGGLASLARLGLGRPTWRTPPQRPERALGDRPMSMSSPRATWAHSASARHGLGHRLTPKGGGDKRRRSSPRTAADGEVREGSSMHLHNQGMVRSEPRRRNGGGSHLGTGSPMRGHRWCRGNFAPVCEGRRRRL